MKYIALFLFFVALFLVLLFSFIPNPFKNKTFDNKINVNNLIKVEEEKDFISPYDEYWITQGIHGQSYNHQAVDIAAGKNATIKTPVSGIVITNTVDQVGNTILVIDGDKYQITMLHGSYIVKVGDRVIIGDKIGEESNHGYTTDMQGNLCNGRDCGYHTHLNVFDKTVGRNVNPLELLSKDAGKQLFVGSKVP